MPATIWSEWQNNFLDEFLYPWAWLHPGWFWDFNTDTIIDSIVLVAKEDIEEIL